MLINNITKLKEVLGGIQKTMNWPTWSPFVEQAELTYIRPAIGDELYTFLTEIETPNAQEQKLIKFLEIATGYFAYWVGLPQLTTIVGDAGVSMSTPSQAQPMAKWAFVNLQRNLLNKAERNLEDGLVFLEQNQDSFESWANSSVYTLTKGSLISGATELTNYFPHAQNSRRLFLAQKNYIAKSEDFFLTQIIGFSLWEAWKEKLLDSNSTYSTKEKYAMRLARFAIANDSFKESIPFLNISEDWRLISETDGILNEDILPAERRNEIRYKCEKEADLFGGRLKQYLNENASNSEFQEYFESNLYQPVTKPKKSPFNNDPDKKYFVI